MKKAVLLAAVAVVVGVASGAVQAGAGQPGANQPRVVAQPDLDCLPGADCDPSNMGWQTEP
ncbi:hypothetical protein GCM10022224_087830 [Nonomuraea antimicrobica]|uniref:Uncharacterized protein n=1 Tax=Nonomuraea antimicrobica TaxID=561173 RepID=A0ABP7DT41_9ACTN